MLAISVYIALRFEWKYAVPVLIALMHDLLITAGVYALTGREVTAATVAALLTILGYSLYDTIIVFDRVRENVPKMPNAAFSQIVNRSMSEVLTRSLATSFCTLLPVLALLLFGGTTLKDFAFALLVGVASGAYSSIFIASPVLTHWKEREPVYRRRRARIVRERGVVPAYATTAGGAREDVEPESKRRRTRRGSLIPRDEPGEQLSRGEFRELVRDLDVEEPAGRPRARRRPAASAWSSARRPSKTREPPSPATARRARPSPNATRRRRAARGPRAQGQAQAAREEAARARAQTREKPLMGLLGWVIMGLALWHFTIFLPDRFWGGIVGAFVGSIVGAMILGLIIYRAVGALAIPGQHATDIAIVLYAVPGALLGIAAVYLEGMRREAKSPAQAPQISA